MDTQIVLWLNSLVGKVPAWDWLMKVAVSDYAAPVLGSVVLFTLWFWGDDTVRFRRQLGTLAGMTAVGFGNWAVQIINHFYFRPRPFVDHPDLQLLFYRPTDSSFPSNPAVVGFAMATAIFLVHRRLGTFMYAVAFTYSFARVYAGVCYPSDVLGGAGIGVAAAFAAMGLFWVCRPLVRLVLTVPRALHLA